MTDDQLSLFDVDHTDVAHYCCDCGVLLKPPYLPGTDNRLECLACNHRYNLAVLMNYARYGRPNAGRNHPGMLFPGQQQGDGEPTPAQREAAIQILRDLWPEELPPA